MCAAGNVELRRQYILKDNARKKEEKQNNNCGFTLQRCVQTAVAAFYFEDLWVCWQLWMFL